MSRSIPGLAVVSVLFAMPVSAVAAERVLYVSTQGAGSKNGFTAEDALPPVALNAALRRTAGVVKVRFVPGDYELTDPVRLIATLPADRIEIDGGGARFRPSKAATATGLPLLIIGRSNLSIANLVVDGYASVAVTQGEALSENVTFRDITADHADIAFRLVSQSGAVRNWTIEGLRASNYRVAGVRISGANTHGITLNRFVLDGGGIHPNGHCFRGGVQISAGASGIRLADGVVANHISTCGVYHQGDGIEADDQDGRPDDITIANVISRHNRDGNFDLKASHVRLINIRSERSPDTRYALRLWNADYECESCRLDGGQVADLFLSRATVVFTGSSLPADGPTLHCDDRHGRQVATRESRPPGGARATCLPQ